LYLNGLAEEVDVGDRAWLRGENVEDEENWRAITHPTPRFLILLVDAVEP
jgi:hypothetical protein